MLTGDAEAQSEKDMVSKKYISKVDVLKVGHHGSKDSSTPAFLNLAKPTYSVISVGAKNSYKHPTTETLSRLTKLKSKLYRTDPKGTIKVVSDGQNISITTELIVLKENMLLLK